MTDEIKFYKLKDPYGCFSNFWRAPFNYDDRTWQTTEHAFQALKFSSIMHQEAIRSQTSPMKAAILGRTPHPSYRLDWEEAKDDVMLAVNFEKYRQHGDLRKTLLSTGRARLIEHSESDRYWADGGDGSGKNMLGITLMKVRELFGGCGVV